MHEAHLTTWERASQKLRVGNGEHGFIADFPPTEARDALLDLVAYTVQRTK